MDKNILYLIGGGLLVYFLTQNKSSGIEATGSLTLPGTGQTVDTVEINNILYVKLSGAWVNYPKLVQLYDRIANAAPAATGGGIGDFLTKYLPDVLGLVQFYQNGGTGTPPINGPLGDVITTNPGISAAILQVFGLSDNDTLTL